VKILDEDEILRRATKLLEQGCTMLAAHHTCGAPLFRCKGEIVCPVCSFEGETKASEPATSPASKEQECNERGPSPQTSRVACPSSVPSAPAYSPSTPSPSSQSPPSSVSPQVARPSQLPQMPYASAASVADDDLKDAEDALKMSIARKLRELAEGIRDERDLGRLKDQLDCIEAAMKVLRSIERP
jgi:UPF0148 protein